jgi:hypothetical protein
VGGSMTEDEYELFFAKARPRPSARPTSCASICKSPKTSFKRCSWVPGKARAGWPMGRTYLKDLHSLLASHGCYV